MSCDAARHGDHNAYRRGCRCPEAVESRRLYMKRWREGRLQPGMVPAVGVTRRLQALSALGWTVNDIAARMGTTAVNVHQMRRGRSAEVTRMVAARVNAVYEELSGTAGPSVRVRGHAQRQGWAPPLAWDDDAIDNPDAKPVTASAPRSRIDLDDLAFLKNLGMTDAEYAARVDVAPDSIERARERQRARTNTAIARAQEAAEQAPLSWASAPTMAAALNEAFGDTHELAS
jgi:hypothetical protein